MTRFLIAFSPAFLLVCLGVIPVSGQNFQIANRDLSEPLKIIVYGDIRFTDPRETDATNPRVRRWLVEQVATENPDAVLLSGDVPWQGGNANDYAVYRSETKIWRDRNLRIFPALGNHEFKGDEKECIQNWWHAFPELRGLRYYSVRLGDSVYLLNLDSNSPLTLGSEQIAWVKQQLASLPVTARFVFLNLHHPPVVDVQNYGDDSHNGRPNEAALAKFLVTAPQKSRVRFIVVAGHVHNYERFYQNGIIYLVSGGGGAKPHPIERGPNDLYQDRAFPNYHYVEFVLTGDKLHGVMFRLADANGSIPRWEEKDHFDIAAP